MGCGSSSAKPVANNKQSSPNEGSNQSAQASQVNSNNANTDNRPERQTSNSQVDIKIEASPHDDQSHTDQSNANRSTREDDVGLHLSADNKGEATTTTENEGMDIGDETKDLGGYSPRNQTIANRDSKTPSSGPPVRYQSSVVRSQAPSTQHQAPNVRSGAPNTRSGAPYTRSHAPNGRSQAPNARSRAPNTKSQVSNAKTQAPDTRYQRNLNVSSTRAGASSPRSGSKTHGSRNAVAPEQQAQGRQQSDRKRILTETNERLIKKEEGCPIQDEKRQRVNEDQSPQPRQRSKHESNGNGQLGGTVQPTRSYQRAAQATGAGNRSGHVGSSQDTDLGAFGELTFPDPGVEPAVYIPPPMVEGDDRNGSPETSAEISSQGSYSGTSAEKVDASVQAQMSLGNDSPMTGACSNEENDGQSSGHLLTPDKLDIMSDRPPLSPSVPLPDDQHAGSEVTEYINQEEGNQTECSGECSVDGTQEPADNASAKTEEASGQTHPGDIVPKSPPSAQSKRFPSPVPKETDSIRSDVHAEESLKEVHIDATIQTLESSITPSVSLEPQTERKRKRKKPHSSPRTDDPMERAKLRRIRLRLRDATLGTDVDELDEAIWLFETHELVDNGDLTNALDRLDFLQLRQDLREALVRRNLGILTRVIEDSRASKHERELGSLLTRAEELRDHLQALDNYSHDILGMDQKLISEIRSYCSPPPSVHEVMAACYMLLGVREERLLEWAEIQSQLGRLGRNGLKNMILNFDPDSVPLEMVLRIKEILNFYRLEDVRIASNGAASFYLWAKNMVDMIDRRGAHADDEESKERAKSAEKQG